MVKVTQAVVLFMALVFSTMAQEVNPNTPLWHRAAAPPENSTPRP